jgi:hypothetical protein
MIRTDSGAIGKNCQRPVVFLVHEIGFSICAPSIVRVAISAEFMLVEVLFLETKWTTGTNHKESQNKSVPTGSVGRYFDYY